MDFTKLKAQQKAQEEEKKKEKEEKELKWPDDYYAVTDAKKRKEVLLRAIEEGIELEENKIRLAMWERRYGKKDGVDELLAAWINLIYFANVVKKDRISRWHKKEKNQILQSLCIDILQDGGETARELLYLEIYHMLDFYMDICKTDKKYSGLILGLGSMSKESVMNKIATEFYRVCYQVPSEFSQLEVYDILRKSALDSYSAKFPSYANTFRYMIEHGGELPGNE
ncbi:MAG: DUF6553 family protein [Ruminococcus sp.]|jgi:hypothetical protein